MRRRRLPTWALVAATAGLPVAAVEIERADLVPLSRLAARWGLGALPAVAVMPPIEIASGVPVLSLALDDAALYGASGILDNRVQHGPEWEREGSVAYFDGGRLRFASGVGVRVHGGASRYSSARQGFRLFFRHRYGPREFPRGILFGPQAQPISRLIVHNDVREDPDGTFWHFVNPFAYDIARAMGAIAPETLPARFYLNGEYYGPFVLTERFDDRYFARHRGHDILLSQASFDEFRAWVDRTRPLTMETVATKADVENLTRWFLSTALCATGDAFQGPGQLLDRTRQNGGWFWVNFDMDMGLRRWNVDSYQELLERIAESPRGRNPAEPRAVLLTHLLSEDPDYRTYFKRLFLQVMNHHVTEAFLEERYRHYLDVSDRLRLEHVDYLPRLREFVTRRPAFFRLITEQWLNTPPSQPVTLRAPEGVALLIDGEAVRSGYSGLYFPDLEVAVDVARPHRASLAGWRVNSRILPVAGPLTFFADRPTEVEALFAPLPHGAPPEPDTPPVPAPPPAPKPVWRSLPTGSFWMGCVPGDQACAEAEKPRTRVRIDVAFEIMAHEVTAGDFRAYATATSRPMPRQPEWYADATHPVVNVTWDEAQNYCGWMGGRLPTETQWEYAARGGVEGRRYPSGDEPPERDTERWPFTTPVGQSGPNGFGLYDTAGNVWEWTLDRFRPTYETDAPEDGDLRTIRGGSWDNGTARLRASARTGRSRSGRHNLYIGFRCVRETAR